MIRSPPAHASCAAAKNILLATPHSLTVYDPATVVHADLASNFFLRPGHVGSRRDESSVPGLQALNDVPVRVLACDALAAELLARFHVVVFTDNRPLAELAAYDAFCRATPQPSSLEGAAAAGDAPPALPSIVFLAGGVLGLAAYAFADFGPAHTVKDADGEAEVLVALTSARVLPPAPGPGAAQPSQLELCADRVLVGAVSEGAFVALSDMGAWEGPLQAVGAAEGGLGASSSSTPLHAPPAFAPSAGPAPRPLRQGRHADRRGGARRRLRRPAAALGQRRLHPDRQGPQLSRARLARRDDCGGAAAAGRRGHDGHAAAGASRGKKRA